MSNALEMARWIFPVVQNAPSTDAYLHIYRVVSAVFEAHRHASATTGLGVNPVGASFQNWFPVMSTVKLEVLEPTFEDARNQRDRDLRNHSLDQPQFGDALK